MGETISEYRSIIQDETEEEYIVTCAYCDGSGTDPAADADADDECPVCKDRTVHMSKGSDNSEKLVKCRFCDGTGHGAPEREDIPGLCPVCVGTGGLPGEFPREVCADCDGTGYRNPEDDHPHEACPTCDGWGSNST